MNVIVGTAGHIDHGKTALVKALTGVDADRLPDEKRRGITIDLGFAEMTVGETRFGFVDVPGHERFVRNMLAGASGIDIVILVIAADEGVMPQTREHFDICRLLGVSSGMIALTKSDLVDAETLEIARMEAAELVAGSFLQAGPMVAVSARTGDGMKEMRSALAGAAAGLTMRSTDLVTMLPIDRSFTVKGFGTVVTGTLASGEISAETRLELMPDGRTVRVRGVQSHGHTASSALAGQRTAVNLAGIGHDEISRGMALVEAGALAATQSIDAHIEVLHTAPRPLRNRQRVRVHIGTAEVLARIRILSEGDEISPGEKGLVQMRLESPAVVIRGERFIIRSYSPQMTIAGGTIIDPTAGRHRAKELARVRKDLDSLRTADDREAVRLLVERSGCKGLTLSELQARTGLRREILDVYVSGDEIIRAGARYLNVRSFAELKAQLLTTLGDAHKRDALAQGVSRESFVASLFRHLDDDIVATVIHHLAEEHKIAVENDRLRLASHRSQLSAEDAEFHRNLLSIYEKAGLEVPRIAEAIDEAGQDISGSHALKLLRLLVESGKLVKLTDEFYVAGTAIARTIELLRSSDREIDVPGFKELTGVSRKYAIPLLEYFDRTRVTARVGDKRIVIK